MSDTQIGWQLWSGVGPCPVPDGVAFRLRFRGDTDQTAALAPWKRDPADHYWHHTGEPSDIIAYELEVPA